MSIIPLLYSVEQGATELQRESGDAGYDLATVSRFAQIIMPGETALVRTGMRMRIPANHVGMVCSRSGLAKNHSVFVLNAPGIIDHSYRGEVGVLLHNAGDGPYTVQPGERVAQLVVVELGRVVPVRVAEDELGSPTKRGTDGFGSTGRTERAA